MDNELVTVTADAGLRGLFYVLTDAGDSLLLYEMNTFK